MDKQWMLRTKYGFAMVPLDVSSTESYKKSYTQASYVRPAILLFPSVLHANQFKSMKFDSSAYSAVLLSSERHTCVDTYINSFTETKAIMYQNDIDKELQPPFTETSWSNTINSSTPVSIDNVDNMQMLLLSIAAYSIYLYIEEVDEFIEGMFTLKGILIDPFSDSKQEHKDAFVKESIVEYLEKLLLLNK